MTMNLAVQDGILPTSGIVHHIQNQRERKRKQKPFPDVSEEDEEPSPAKSPAIPKPNVPKDPYEEEDEHSIDIHVLGRIIPTGQFLQPPLSSAMIH